MLREMLELWNAYEKDKDIVMPEYNR